MILATPKLRLAARYLAFSALLSPAGCSVGFLSFDSQSSVDREPQGGSRIAVEFRIEVPSATNVADGAVQLPSSDCKEIHVVALAEVKEGASKRFEPTPVSADTKVELSGLGATTPYRDAACTNAFSVDNGTVTDTIPAGQERISLFIRNFSLESFTLSVKAKGYREGDRAFQFVSSRRWRLSGNGEALFAGTCKQYTLTLLEIANNLPASGDAQARFGVKVTAKRKLNSAQAAGEFFATQLACETTAPRTGPVEHSFNLAPRTSTVTFWFRVSRPEVIPDPTTQVDPINMRAEFSGIAEGLAAFDAKVDARYVTLERSGAPVERADICNGPYDITVGAGTGNTISWPVSLTSNTLLGQFYSDALCTVSISNPSQYQVSAGGSRVYYREPTTVNGVDLRATASKNSVNFSPAATLSSLNFRTPLSEEDNDEDSVNMVTTGMTVQADGRIIVVGYTTDSTPNLILRRYSAAGDFQNQYVSPVVSEGRAVVQDGTWVYAVGFREPAGAPADRDLFFVKVRVSDFQGAVENTRINDTASEEAFGVALYGGSLLAVVGKRNSSGLLTMVNRGDLSVDASRQPTFAFGGAGSNEARSVVAGTGEIFIGGKASNRFGLARYVYATNSFSHSQRYTPVGYDVNVEPAAIAMQGTRIVMAGNTPNTFDLRGDVVLARVEAANLNLDPNFGGDGFIDYTMNGSSAKGVKGLLVYPQIANHPDSLKLVAYGFGTTGYVERFLSDGRPDPLPSGIRRFPSIKNDDAVLTGGFLSTSGVNTNLIFTGHNRSTNRVGVITMSR